MDGCCVWQGMMVFGKHQGAFPFVHMARAGLHTGLHIWSSPPQLFISFHPALSCQWVCLHQSPFCKRPLLHFIKPPSIATVNSSIKMLTHTPRNSLTSWCISSKGPRWCLDVRTLKAQISYSHIVKMMVLQTSQCVIKQLNCDVANEKLKCHGLKKPNKISWTGSHSLLCALWENKFIDPSVRRFLTAAGKGVPLQQLGEDAGLI